VVGSLTAQDLLAQVSLGGVLDGVQRHLLLAALLLAFTLAGYAAGWLAVAVQRLVVRGRPTSGQQIFAKSLVVFLTVLGFAVGISQAYGANLGAVAASLGVASLALGFGLQNTVANLAAGVSLSVDKPFEVGDRIQVGETWGDAVAIGLRSTLIRVTGGQTVSIPNAMLDTREVWNSTYGGNQWLRVEVPVSISYESSIPLAESLSLAVARGRPEVLAYPPPQVRVRRFADSGIELELRCWISHAQEKAWITDRLLRGIKDAFDREGVVFPFPQRTLTMAKEQAPPARTPPQLKGPEEPPGKILAVVRTHDAVPRIASSIVEFAARVGASLTVLHVRPVHQMQDRVRGEAILNEFLSSAREMGVTANGRLEVGTVARVIPRVAKEEGASLVLLGHGAGRSWAFWVRDEVQAIKRDCPVPLLAMEVAQLLRPEVLDHWRHKLAAQEERPAGAVPGPAKPT
jgi:small-conductance mechanosensitive channel